MSLGLILEGGGMRGVYTAGVLQYFMEKDLYIPYVIGVSAGACQGTSYVSKQPLRNKEVSIDYVTHPDYLSYKNFIKKGEMFGMDLIFHDIPTKHVPFDFETFRSNEQKFIVGVTDCQTGLPLYYEKNELDNDELLTVVRASSSIPYFAPKVKFRNKYLLDGGISDSIPLKKSEQDGNTKNIIISTRNPGYRKKKTKISWIIRKTNSQNKELADMMLNRYQVYNETLDYISEQEKRGNVFVIQPSKLLMVKRMERNKERLESLYNQGYEDAREKYESLIKWIKN